MQNIKHLRYFFVGIPIFLGALMFLLGPQILLVSFLPEKIAFMGLHCTNELHQSHGGQCGTEDYIGATILWTFTIWCSIVVSGGVFFTIYAIGRGVSEKIQNLKIVSNK